jgi:hypothetical protein
MQEKNINNLTFEDISYIDKNGFRFYNTKELSKKFKNNESNYYILEFIKKADNILKAVRDRLQIVTDEQLKSFGFSNNFDVVLKIRNGRKVDYYLIQSLVDDFIAFIDDEAYIKILEDKILNCNS